MKKLRNVMDIGTALSMEGMNSTAVSLFTKSLSLYNCLVILRALRLHGFAKTVL